MPAAMKGRAEQKRVAISSKRQFTIPQKFYQDLGFDREAVCIKGEGVLIIRPAASPTGGEFAENILAELIAEGYEGSDLLREFKIRQANVRPAMENMLEKARAAAEGIGEYATYDDVFGPED